jgi:hypothetical protein
MSNPIKAQYRLELRCVYAVSTDLKYHWRISRHRAVSLGLAPMRWLHDMTKIIRFRLNYDNRSR